VALIAAPGLAALAFVAIHHYGHLSGRGAVGLVLLGFAAIYYWACIAVARRSASLPKVALAGWAAALTIACVFAGRAAYKALKVDSRTRADALHGLDWPEQYFREGRGTSRTYWQPYVYWRRIVSETKYINVDERGIRRSWSAPDAGTDAPRIFFFGGSTMWGTGAPDEGTIPSLVAKTLADGRAPVRVVNFGELGYVSTQGLIRLLLELRRGNVPDLVVTYDGVNDTYAAFQTRQPGIPQNESRRRQDYMRGWGGSPPPPREWEREELADAVAALYRENVRVLAALAKEYGFELVSFWQPSPYVGKPLTEYEQEVADARGQPMAEFVRLGYAAVAKLKFPPCFHDISGVFDSQKAPRYIDWCHIAPQGNAEVVTAMMPHLLAALDRAASSHSPESSNRRGDSRKDR